MRWLLRSAFTLVLSALPLAAASAQTYPNRAITWVVPSSAGGVTDLSARVIAKPLSAKLGVPVIVDPRPGAGGIVATEFVANAKPDGYTLLLATSGTIATNPWLYKKLSYDPITSFKPVIALSDGITMLLVPQDSRFKTLKDLIDYAKANPGKLNFGSAGPGTGQHLALEMLKNRAGIDVTHVPFKGATPAQAALLSGTIDATFDYYSPVRANVEAGKLRALVVMGPKRSANVPDVPTLREAGYDASLTGWSTVLAPAGTPDDVIKTLIEAFTVALNDKEFIDYVAANASQRIIPVVSGEALNEFHRAEMKKIGDLIRQAGIEQQ